ncbi:hypothetical protein [Zooshikella ganghwensis]|uniref:DUF4240 domain-containing protein n=1 Tax=Zooshikella ganghwensis TaxID=202772 RepID=A0A4P9VPJ6_9GAMM|nr:hypothetical protein [Zooshikella ganghwensis]RDH44619.1 hypothetical protein B9G39_14910 [Zooshikella ganghwensis]
MFEHTIQTLEPTNFLWAIISRSDRSLSKLISQLEELNKDDLIKFQLEYKIAVLNVVPDIKIELELDDSDLYVPTYDHRIEFAEWAVSLGKDFYDKMLAQPTCIQTYFKNIYTSDSFSNEPLLDWDNSLEQDSEYQDSTVPHLIAYPIFEKKFDEDLWEIVDDLLE